MAPVRFLAALLGIMAAACGGVAPAETLKVHSRAAQQAAGLMLPASAQVVFAHSMHGLDDAAQIIATMPIADWDALERQIEVTVPGMPPPSRDGAGYLGTDQGEWQPGKQPGLTARQVPWRKGTQSLNIGAAPAAPGTVRVFIFWFET
jgi:hypothetical protein